jgi:hypothetical protein
MSRKKNTRSSAKQQQEVKVKAARSSLSLSHKWIISLILGVTFLAFANTLYHDFAYDDTTQILKNEVIRSFSNIPTAFTKEVWFWRVLQDKDPNKESGPTTPYYRPMFTVYLMAGWFLFETWAPGWHLINLLMHLLAVYFAFLVLNRITKNIQIASIATLLFALHPLRAESVAWISGVTDLFLALFILPSFYLYMIYREKNNIHYLTGSVFLFLLATFAKEPAIALPVFIFAYEIFIFHQGQSIIQRLKPALLYSFVFLLVAMFYFVMRYNALGFILSDARYASYPFHQVLMTIPIVICKYIGLLFWPMNLSIFHATPMVTTLLSWRFIVPVLIIAVIAAGLWQLRNNTIARFAILWFAINLLPVLNLSAFGEEFLVQERYVYISSIGFSLLLAMGLVKIPIEKWFTLGSRRTAQAVLVGLIALLMTGRTIAQNAVWKNDMTLWEHGAEVAEDQPMPHYVLGHKYFNLQEIDMMAKELERFMELKQDNLIVITNLASAHLILYQEEIRKTGKGDRSHLDRIIALCELGLRKNEQTPTLLDTLGTAYTYEGELRNFDRAIWFMQHGLGQEPSNPVFNLHLGQAFLMRGDAARGDIDNALHYLNTACKLQDSIYDGYKFLAYAYRAKGQFQEAVENFNRYLKMQPTASDAPIITQQLKDLQAQMDKASPQS